MTFSIKDFVSKYDQIRKKLRIWSHLLKKSLIENFIFCVVLNPSAREFRPKRTAAEIAKWRLKDVVIEEDDGDIW